MNTSHSLPFEHLILLVVAHMNGEAYGAALIRDIKSRRGRNVTLSAVYVALYQLKRKNMVTATWNEAGRKRGGCRKRLFTITPCGIDTLLENSQVRNGLWQLIFRPIQLPLV